jgi:hypothetical protein
LRDCNWCLRITVILSIRKTSTDLVFYVCHPGLRCYALLEHPILRPTSISMRKLLDHFLHNRLWPDQNSADRDSATKGNTKK